MFYDVMCDKFQSHKDFRDESSKFFSKKMKIIFLLIFLGLLIKINLASLKFELKNQKPISRIAIHRNKTLISGHNKFVINPKKSLKNKTSVPPWQFIHHNTSIIRGHNKFVKYYPR